MRAVFSFWTRPVCPRRMWPSLSLHWPKDLAGNLLALVHQIPEVLVVSWASLRITRTVNEPH